MADPVGDTVAPREGTGEAVVFGQSSFDPLQSTANILSRQEEVNRQKRNKIADAYSNLYDNEVEGWDIDNERELRQMESSYMKLGLDYLQKGVDPSDPTQDPEAYAELQRVERAMKNAASESIQQKQNYIDALKLYQKNPGKYDPKTLENLKNYRQASINDRVNIAPTSLLVPKRASALEVAKTVADGMKTSIQQQKPYIDQVTGNRVFPSIEKVSDKNIELNAFTAYSENPELQKQYPGEEGYKRFEDLVRAQLGVKEKVQIRQGDKPQAEGKVGNYTYGGGKANSKRFNFGYTKEEQEVTAPILSSVLPEGSRPGTGIIIREAIPIATTSQGKNPEISITNNEGKEERFRPTRIVRNQEGEWYLQGTSKKKTRFGKAKEQTSVVPYDDVRADFELKYDEFNLDEFVSRLPQEDQQPTTQPSQNTFTLNGEQYTREELKSAGWTDEQIQRLNQ